ncbi:MAG: MFS transporter, partial [Bacillota bacterium]|nr:MFS transporter [Bacillota bacterium]
MKHYVLTFGHLCSDIAHGALSAILPFLIAAYHFDYTTAAILVMVANIVASVIQPIFGHIADKIDNPRIMVYGVFLAGGGMALTGVLSSFTGLCIAVMISGVGSALFHPQAAQLVNRNADDDSIGFHLGVFSFGGNLGFTLGPIVATAFISLFGLPGTLIFFVPAMIFGVLSTKFFPKGESPAKASAVEPEAAEGSALCDSESKPKYKDRWGAFAKLGILVGFRSIVYSGVGTFLVLYFIDVLGQSESTGNLWLSFYYAVSALAALFGGKLADNFGHRKTVWLSFAILLPASLLFTLSGNYWFCVLMLIPMGAGLNIGYSPLVLMGQRYLPNHV